MVIIVTMCQYVTIYHANSTVTTAMWAMNVDVKEGFMANYVCMYVDVIGMTINLR